MAQSMEILTYHLGFRSYPLIDSRVYALIDQNGVNPQRAINPDRSYTVVGSGVKMR